MSFFDLTPLETRVFGCLLEKERLTPENYPLSLNSLTAACNQTTNREPVVSYDEKTVESGLNSLREKKLASVIFGAGSRVQKYRHKLLDHYELSSGDVAVICVLLLRGAQTPGELRARTERMHYFENTAALEGCLNELGQGEYPLVRFLPARPGQKEGRYIQLLSASPTDHEEPTGSPPPLNPTFPSESSASPRPQPSQTYYSQTQAAVASAPMPEPWEAEVAKLRTELEQLREEFRAFRKQFE
jgi:uncharacterized protein YceH (UPF0502 family)